MLDAVLHLVEGGEFEEVGVLGGDVVVGGEGVGERDVLIPAVGAGDLLAAQGVEGGGAEREGGELEVDEACLDIVRLAQGGGEVESSTQLGRVGDAGGGGAVEVVVAVGGVLVVVAALEVHIGREAAAGVGLGILVVFPHQLEVAELLEGGAVAGDALLGDAVADVEIAFEFVADVVVAACFGGPAEVGVDFAEEGEVDVVVDSEVVAAVFEVVSAVVHPTIVGHENAGGAVVSHGEEGKGEDERCGDIFDGDVGGAGKNAVMSLEWVKLMAKWGWE